MMEFAAPNKVPRQARKPLAESQSMIAPAASNIAGAACISGTR